MPRQPATTEHPFRYFVAYMNPYGVFGVMDVHRAQPIRDYSDVMNVQDFVRQTKGDSSFIVSAFSRYDT